MKTIKQPKQPIARFFSLGVIALTLFGLSAALKGQDAKTNAPSKDPPRSDQATGAGSKPESGSTNSVSASAKQLKPRAKQLTGAELYSMHCARCHPERYPNDRTSAQWKTVAMHMRVRANLPADHFRKLLKYLQENSGY